MSDITGVTLGRATARITLDASGMVAQSRVAIDATKGIGRAAQDASKELDALQRSGANGMAGVAQSAAAAQKSVRALSTEVQQMQMTRVGAQGLQVIDFDALEQARQSTRQLATEVRTVADESRNLNSTVKQATTSFGALAGALGVTFGAAQVVRAAVANEQLATSYERQYIAATQLAGGQDHLNELLAAYEEASGGIADRQTALAETTRLMALGFADSAEELERFVRAVRGASLATGKSQDFIVQRLQLELLNQTGKRLDEVGLGMAEIQARTEQLAAANRGLTQEQIYQEAVLQLLAEKFDGVTRSAAGQKTGLEELQKTWKDFRLGVGLAGSGVVDFMSLAIAQWLKTVERDARVFSDTWEMVARNIRAAAQQTRDAINGMPGFPTGSPGGSVGGFGGGGGGGGFRGEAGMGEAEMRAAAAIAREAIVADTLAQINETEAQYGAQRERLVSNYAMNVARQEQDFARNRERTHAAHLAAMAEVQAKAAEAEARMIADHQERLADIRAQSAQRTADWQEDYDRRVAQWRVDHNKRVSEIEADYQRNRERAAEDHRESLLSAAGNLDAAAVAAEQRRYAREQAEAERAHQERIDEEQAGLDERIAREQESHRIRMEREQRNLNERISQEQAAHAKRLADARAAEAKRLEDMAASYAEQRRKEDEDRAIRLARQAEDHDRQLAEMESTHQNRLAQIRRQEAKNLAEWEAAHTKALEELGIYNEEWRKIQRTEQDLALKDWDEWWKEFRKRFAPDFTELPEHSSGGPITRTGPALIHAGEYVLNPRTTAALHSMLGGFDQRSLLGAVAGGGRSVSVGEVSIMVNGGSGSPDDIAQTVRRVVIDVFSEIGAGA